jgi:AcrR family transcriptional regulator
MPDGDARADDLRTRILDRAIEAASIHGVKRMSVADVAKRAGISRPTLYKQFPSKEALVSAAVARESERLIASVIAAAAQHDDPRQALEAAVLAALRLTREHPLLDGVIRTEPESLIPMLVSDGGPVMTAGRRAVEQVVATKLPDLPELAVRRLADLLVRLLVSYALNPPDDPPEVVAESMAGFLSDPAIVAQSHLFPNDEARP